MTSDHLGNLPTRAARNTMESSHDSGSSGNPFDKNINEDEHTQHPKSNFDPQQQASISLEEINPEDPAYRPPTLAEEKGNVQLFYEDQSLLPPQLRKQYMFLLASVVLNFDGDRVQPYAAYNERIRKKKGTYKLLKPTKALVVIELKRRDPYYKANAKNRKVSELLSMLSQIALTDPRDIAFVKYHERILRKVVGDRISTPTAPDINEIVQPPQTPELPNRPIQKDVHMGGVITKELKGVRASLDAIHALKQQELENTEQERASKQEERNRNTILNIKRRRDDLMRDRHSLPETASAEYISYLEDELQECNEEIKNLTEIIKRERKEN
ncbi:hypothetical protein IV203_022220 [Nitzschia inconspicua]|uniref:Uncharacterized protein n=1 Tax=Nitzschia inconspicua TaxID=303405 RepID=A0A9K3KIH9_9STRA|nr:hypothetical protein IV203_022220 [Nitzschia inconspicua]